ncbi:NAD(P)-dependent dehydrogenase, short-chain alcohol dehydrogenase family [Sphingobium sp. YR657]|uniref:SDR family NAD(P)-dependent oxidoreductase n=1 Tax=Sphingobium sp. YR657 TaxID=1884366 RepID=UPI000911EF6C|nr:glucose 1-dehydrogenase [Sphingobium sp. YR657]SHM45638.1 NAD(P)-dependent dehydrogenase, short-chain alcohol dehydrogenase family [Sphingobium sp. YR657]
MNPTYDFGGKVAFITGAQQGIGYATARGFAECGASVVLADVDDGKVHEAAERLCADGFRAIGVRCDVSDEDQVAAAIAQTIASFGRLDMAFNNAGVQAPKEDIADQDAGHFDRVVAINLRGIWASMKHELKHMRAQGSGAIVNCASVGGLVGTPDLAAYNAAKHGVIGLTRSAALTYASRGIQINAVCPGTIDTPMVAAMVETQPEAMEEINRAQAIGRLGKPEEVAAAVLWLASPGASFVHGAFLAVDGGFSAN